MKQLAIRLLSAALVPFLLLGSAALGLKLAFRISDSWMANDYHLRARLACPVDVLKLADEIENQTERGE